MFILVNCEGGLSPDDLPVFETLEDAIAAIPQANPDFDTVFVMEVSDGKAEVVYVPSVEEMLEDTDKECEGGCGRRAADCLMWESPEDGVCGDRD